MITVQNISKILNNFNYNYGIRTIFTTNRLNLDQEWRTQKRLSKNPNAEGPLTDNPDYSFLDGKPVALGSRQKQRLLKQREFASKIVTLCGELDFAKTRYNNMINAANKKEPSPLKPKGHLLLKK